MWKYQPDFNQMLKVLRNEKPDRPVLFELFLSDHLNRVLAGHDPDMKDPYGYMKMIIDAAINGGYDYCTLHGDFNFDKGSRPNLNSISLNEGFLIYDWESFEKYKWTDPSAGNYDRFEKLASYIPENFKFMVMAPDGVLENVIRIVGYDNLCMLLYDDEELVQAVFDNVGSRLLKYFEICLQYDTVGFISSNDDWGFNTQTFLSPAQMRKYVFPWHKKIVEAAHKAGKPAILHSCGNPVEIMDDVIDDMKFDARHSFEDNIIPIEDAYRRWGDRIPQLGGMDMDMMTRGDPKVISKRASDMLDLAETRGGYALGTGNSIAPYIPDENYFAMAGEALRRR